MIKWYERIGNYLFNYIFAGLLLFLATVLIFPFYAIYVGLIAFFKEDANFKTIFKTIKSNYKNIVFMTVFFIMLLGLIFLTILIDNSEFKNNFNLFVRYLIVGIIIFLLIYPPVVMIEMNVTFKQVIKNSFYLSLTNFVRTLAMFVLTALFIWLLTVEILVVLLFIPFVQTISYLTNKSLLEVKQSRGEEE